MPSTGQVEPTTGYYIYAVVPVGTDVPSDVRGVDEAELERIDYGSLAAIVSLITLERPPGRSAELRAHGNVVDALATTGPVVPAQFGAIMADRVAVIDELLVPRHDPLDDLLNRLDGLRQFRLRATYVEDQVLAEVVQENPEIGSLHQRTRGLGEDDLHPDKVRLGELVSRALEGKRANDAEVVMSAVRPHVVAEAPQTGGGGVDHLLAVAMLVQIDHKQEFETALEQLAEAVHERVRLALVGPMAPYDFVEGEPWV